LTSITWTFIRRCNLARFCDLPRCILQLLTLQFCSQRKRGALYCIIVCNENSERTFLTAHIAYFCRILSCLVLLPVILAHPIASASLPHSWDFLQGEEGWLLYSFYSLIMIGIILCSIGSSYACQFAYNEFHSAQMRLVSLASKTEGLLETAIPSVIAKDLICGRPAHDLTESFSSATVAFICLAGFEETTCRLTPSELMKASPRVSSI
jgi:hypothetical protein